MTENPSRAEPGWPAVVVGGGYFTGLTLMRNLVKRGVRAVCIDYHLDNPAFRSVYGKTYACPNPEADPSGWVAFMVDLSAKLGGRPAFIASADRFVDALAAHVDALEPHYVFHKANVALQAALAVKSRQYALADEHGMPVPRTRTLDSLADLRAFTESAHFPCLLKPQHAREWEPLPDGHPLRNKKLITAGTPRELETAYELAAPASPRMVVQEIISGPDTAKVVYLSCYGKDGRRLGACVVRELRTDPIGYGSASVVEPADDPEVDLVCDRFLTGIGYVGLCEIELKRDDRDGRLLMIEANPRYSVTADAAPYAGVDLGWIHYLDLIGRDVVPVSPDGRTFRHISLHRDFSTYRNYRRAGLETFRSYLKAYRKPAVFFDWDPRDWKVAARTMADLARIVVGPTLRRLIPKRQKS